MTGALLTLTLSPGSMRVLGGFLTNLRTAFNLTTRADCFSPELLVRLPRTTPPSSAFGAGTWISFFDREQPSRPNLTRSFLVCSCPNSPPVPIPLPLESEGQS